MRVVRGAVGDRIVRTVSEASRKLGRRDLARASGARAQAFEFVDGLMEQLACTRIDAPSGENFSPVEPGAGRLETIRPCRKGVGEEMVDVLDVVPGPVRAAGILSRIG